MEQRVLDDVQGLAVFGYNLPLLHFLFFRIDSPQRGQAWLSKVIPEVTTAGTGEKQPESLNVGFTHRGLKALGLADSDLSPFDAEFKDGIESRADVLGDSGESHPSKWRGGLGTPDLHGVLMLFDDKREELEARRRRHRQLMDAAGGVTFLSEQGGAALHPATAKREHFGFRDGISRVTLKGTGTPRPGSPAVEPGEFVLGHRDEAGAVPGAAHPFAHNGTFLVYRKLYQDVAKWRRLIAEAAEDLDMSPELVAAKIMGRWASGAPLMLAPEEDDPSLAADDKASNYTYASDPDGFRCPFGAHSRRANPRDDFGKDGKMDVRHLLMRRGLPYGLPLPDGVSTDDKVDRGVVGVFVNASISRQFEHVQRLWMNDPKLRGRTTSDKDVIAGDHDGTFDFTIQEWPFARHIPRLPRVTQVRGGAYLFAPSMTALRVLAGVSDRATLPLEVPAMTDQPSPTETGPVPPPSAAPVSDGPSQPVPAGPTTPAGVQPAPPEPAAAVPTQPAPPVPAAMEPTKDIHFYLTTITKIKDGMLPRLTAVLAAVAKRPPDGGPLDEIATVHFARWAVIDDGTRLLFTSAFDGELDDYLDDFIEKASEPLDAVWSNCEGYPAGGAEDVAGFKKFVHDMMVPNAVEYSAYPDATVREVKSALAARRKFREFLQEFRK